MKKLRIIALISLGISLLGGCIKEDINFYKSIFIEDPLNPGLPLYSEWGYNTFGAYIDRVPFISEQFLLPAKVIVNPDTLNFTLNGKNAYDPISLKFSILGFSPDNYEQLVSLNGKKFNLKDKNCIVTLITRNDTSKLHIINGELHFQRVQKLLVDKNLERSILSGTFEFQTFRNKEPVTISNGRFDVGVGYDNFYNY